MQTVLGGRPGLFLPDVLGAWQMAVGGYALSLLDSSPTRETLQELVDFDRLNGGRVRLTFSAVDAETGEDVVFDTQGESITPDHLRASTSMPVLFEPVKIGSRWLVDGGMSANLPVRLALGEPLAEDTLCIALDLLPARGSLPTSIGEAAQRAQDLIFASQSRHAIHSLGREYRLRSNLRADGAAAATTLLHLVYGEEARETALKSLDFTRDSICGRWAAGKADMVASLEQLASLPTPDTGSLAIFGLENKSLRSMG